MASSEALSPEETISSASGPRTEITPLGQLSLAALTSACAASSGDLNDCWALAAETEARIATAAARQLILAGNEKISVMTVSPFTGFALVWFRSRMGFVRRRRPSAHTFRTGGRASRRKPAN